LFSFGFNSRQFASFQRQLNYFGFRKIAGKGKMSPCSYVNEGASSDIRSLLLIKRKTNGSAARKAAMQQRSAAAINAQLNPAVLGMNLQQLAAASSNPLLANAMALLSENALRAGLGQLPTTVNSAQLNLLALQRQQAELQAQIQAQQDQLRLQQLVQHSSRSHEQLAALLPSQKPPVFSSPSRGQEAGKPPATTSSSNGANKPPSLQDLQAQLVASFAANQHQAAAGGILALQPPSVASSAAAAAAAAAAAISNPATAALQAQNLSMPATAAADASSASQAAAAQANGGASNPFESAINLQLLLQEHQESQRRAAAGQNPSVTSTMSLLHRLPSSGAFLSPGQPGDALTSSLSIGNFLGSSNRLNSLLSINSLGSREPSLADFAAFNAATYGAAAGSGSGVAGHSHAANFSAQLAAAVAAAQASSGSSGGSGRNP
jgi:hypothetical protein